MLLRIVFATLLAVGGVGLLGCGPATPTCSQSTCTGCCGRDGLCAAGTSVTACGSSGFACDACVTGQICSVARRCEAAGGSGGGIAAGGGSATGGGAAGGGATTCGPSNCTGCCSNNVCQAGTLASACGRAGSSCISCPSGDSCTNGACFAPTCSPSNCAGCCLNNMCQTAGLPSACGQGGGVCVSCPSGQSCTNGSCVAAACGPANCAGCCFNNACQTGTAPAACGVGGAACTTCPTNYTCATGTCRGCQTHTDCTTATDVCINNQCVSGLGRMYTIRAVSAVFPTMNPNTTPASTWDLGGGAPDPFVCLYLDGATMPVGCSGPPGVSDTFSATWNWSRDITVNSTTLVGITAWDEDTTTHDRMGGFDFPSSASFISYARRGGITGPAYTGDPVSWNVTITVR